MVRFAGTLLPLVLAATGEAMAAHGADIRADSARKSPKHVQGQRAMVRHYVDSIADRHQRIDGKEVTQTRRHEVMEAMAEGLGLEERNGRIDGMESRGDAASFFEGEHIAKDPMIVRPTVQARALQNMLPTRSINPSAMLAEVRGVEYHGKAKLWKSGMTELPRSGYTTDSRRVQVQTIVTSTSITWDNILYGQMSDLDPVRENAEAAQRDLLDTYEEMLRTGGGSEVDLQGVQDVAVSRYNSSVDYTSATIGAMYADLIAGLQSIQEANGDRGGVPNALMMSTTWLRLLMRANNLDAGGSATGSELFGMLAGRNAALGQAMAAAGISQIIPCPQFNSWEDEADKGAALALQIPNSGGMRKVLALAPSPVRTSSSLLADETLWALRFAGVEAPIATATGVLTAKIR